MQGLNAAEILRTWEDGRDLDPLRRALILLGAARPTATWDELWSLPIGRRDALLLELRARTFGDRIEIVAKCAACGAAAEAVIEARALYVPAPSPIHELDLGGVQVRYRLPDSRDLEAVLALEGPAAAGELRRRCILAIEGGDGAPELSPASAARIDEHMAGADPQADMELRIECPSCGEAWLEPFDIGQLLFAEIDHEAHRLVSEVDLLARLYGWREADILAMSAVRRASYLELAGG